MSAPGRFPGLKENEMVAMTFCFLGVVMMVMLTIALEDKVEARASKAEALMAKVKVAPAKAEPETIPEGMIAALKAEWRPSRRHTGPMAVRWKVNDPRWAAREARFGNPQRKLRLINGSRP
jgi:hypothetical protein